MSTLTRDVLLYEELFSLPAEEQARILAEEPEPVAIRTVCAWCAEKGIETVMVDGPLDAEGRCSHGMCAACLAEQRARIRAKAAR